MECFGHLHGFAADTAPVLQEVDWNEKDYPFEEDIPLKSSGVWIAKKDDLGSPIPSFSYHVKKKPWAAKQGNYEAYSVDTGPARECSSAATATTTGSSSTAPPMIASKSDQNGECMKRGMDAEQKFVDIMATQGELCRKSTKFDDVENHIDMWVFNTQTKEEYSVDIKAKHRISRSDENDQSDWMWVELHSVRPYNKGWLLDGKAKYIAQEVDNDVFLLLDREKLLDFVLAKVDRTQMVDSPKKAYYKSYQRRDKCDEIALVNMNDLLQPEHNILVRKVSKV